MTSSGCAMRAPLAGASALIARPDESLRLAVDCARHGMAERGWFLAR
jgi:hypothetical protein